MGKGIKGRERGKERKEKDIKGRGDCRGEGKSEERERERGEHGERG